MTHDLQCVLNSIFSLTDMQCKETNLLKLLFVK